MFEPDAKPMSRQYTIVNPMMTLLLAECGNAESERTAAGSQSASDELMHMKSVIIMRL